MGPIRLTWRLESQPAAGGAFTVGLAPVGGPYGTRLGTEVQFRGTQALFGDTVDDYGDAMEPQSVTCAPGSVFTLEWDAGNVTLLIVNPGGSMVGPTTWSTIVFGGSAPNPDLPLVAYFTSDRAGDSLSQFNVRTFTPPYWRTPYPSGWSTLENPTQLNRTAGSYGSPVVSLDSQSNGTQSASAQFDFTVNTAPNPNSVDVVVGFTQNTLLNSLPDTQFYVVLYGSNVL